MAWKVSFFFSIPWKVAADYPFSSLRLRHDFPHDIFKRIFLNENIRISMKISMKFIPEGPINNIPSLVQIMAWHRTGNKPLFEAMMA